MIRQIVALSLVLACWLSITAQYAHAQDTQPAPPIAEPLPRATYTAAKLQEKLDDRISSAFFMSEVGVTIDNMLLIDVLRQLEGEQARWLDVPGSTLSFLPYGENTRVTLRAPGDTTIRRLLTLLLNSQGLEYRIIEDDQGRGVLRVVPTPELAHIGRRATIEEMELLNITRTARVADWKSPLAEQLSKLAGRPIDFKFNLSGIDPAAAYKRFNDLLAGMAPNTVAGLIDQFCNQVNCTWRIEGNSIVIVDNIKQVMHQLGRRVSVRWSDVPLEDALRQIARTAGLVAQFQPGMMQGIETGSRRITFQTPDESIIQIIELLAARTGIGYEVRETSILFTGPRRMDAIIGTVTMPSKTGQFGFQAFLRRSQLSPQAQEALDRRLLEAADALAKELLGDAPQAKPE